MPPPLPHHGQLLRQGRKTQRTTPVSRTAQALDRRTHLRLAQLVTPSQQRLRTSPHLRRNHDPHRIRAPAPATITLVSGQVLRSLGAIDWTGLCIPSRVKEAAEKLALDEECFRFERELHT